MISYIGLERDIIPWSPPQRRGKSSWFGQSVRIDLEFSDGKGDRFVVWSLNLGMAAVEDGLWGPKARLSQPQYHFMRK